MSETSTAINVVSQRQAKLVREFTALPSWEDRYKRLIEYGKRLQPMPQDFYDEKYKVKGCQSQVWMKAELTPEKKVRFHADSDALIVKGLVALLLEVYSDATPEEILSASPQFLKDLGFEAHLSPSRANGLYSMLRRIVYDATAYHALARMGGKP